MDFRKLSYFEAVCRLGNFTKASKELHVSQPSVTMAIQSLEVNLNVQLIKRDKDGLLLMPEGEVLYKKAQLMIDDFMACGGVIAIVTGLRIAQIKSMNVSSLLPALLLVMPISWLWTMVFS